MTKHLSSIDSAKLKFQEISKHVEQLGDQIETEADTRLQVINKILVEVLGWRDGDIKAELWTGAGYADYLIRNGSTSVMVVEAKRASNQILDTRLPHSLLSCFWLCGRGADLLIIVLCILLLPPLAIFVAGLLIRWVVRGLVAG